METVRACLEGLELAQEAAERGSRSAITGAAAAALLAQAGMRGAALPVRIHLSAIADQAWRQAREDELAASLERGARPARTVDDFVGLRI